MQYFPCQTVKKCPVINIHPLKNIITCLLTTRFTLTSFRTETRIPGKILALHLAKIGVTPA